MVTLAPGTRNDALMPERPVLDRVEPSIRGDTLLLTPQCCGDGRALAQAAIDLIESCRALPDARFSRVLFDLRARPCPPLGAEMVAALLAAKKIASVVEVFGAPEQDIGNLKRMGLMGPKSPVTVLTVDGGNSSMERFRAQSENLTLRDALIGVFNARVEQRAANLTAQSQRPLAPDQFLTTDQIRVIRTPRETTLVIDADSLLEDTTASREFSGELLRLAHNVEPGARLRVVLDAVTGSVGADVVGAFVVAQRGVEERGATMVLSGVQDKLREKLVISKLMRFLTVE